jgi:hypothetical protein
MYGLTVEAPDKKNTNSNGRKVLYCDLFIILVAPVV